MSFVLLSIIFSDSKQLNSEYNFFQIIKFSNLLDALVDNIPSTYKLVLECSKWYHL